MVRPRPPKPPDDIYEASSRFGLTTNRPLASLFLLDDNLPFHATRLILLIALTGTPGIQGRTKLAKLDFFVRYPSFLLKAAEIVGNRSLVDQIKQFITESPTIESHMIRYKYGPWDKKYYLVLAYMSGKKLIDNRKNGDVDNFILTEKGKDLAAELQTQSEFDGLAKRCRIVGSLFGAMSGTIIKDFIYKYFPEVVQLPQKQIIPITKKEHEHGTQ